MIYNYQCVRCSAEIERLKLARNPMCEECKKKRAQANIKINYQLSKLKRRINELEYLQLYTDELFEKRREYKLLKKEIRK